MVSRLVKQQHVRLRQQQAAQRDPPLLTARQRPDFRIPWGQTQRTGGDLKLVFTLIAAGGDDRLIFGLFGGQRIKIGIRFGIGRIDRIEFFTRFVDLAKPTFHRLAHGLLWIEFGLLGQITDLQIRHRPGFALDIGVDAGHDL